MVTAITNGVKISVQVNYQEPFSFPVRSEYMFSYKIRIENMSDNVLQLLSRHWHIFDSDGIWREVTGEGVVGEQPVLQPSEVFEYSSGCYLRTGMGKMFGTFKMEDQKNYDAFEANIPEFKMFAPVVCN